VYAIVILLYRKWFLALHPFVAPASFTGTTTFSIIIPARNEEENIQQCLLSILQQQYPTNLFEVIVIDDHSTDNTVNIIQHLQKQYCNLQLLSLANLIQSKEINSYKKKAIEAAIQITKHEWIITTDADCIVAKTWLHTNAAYIQQYKPVFVGAPVLFSNNGSLLSTFQQIDFMTMQGVTAAAVSAGFHDMCNGANLAYKKEVFNEVEGFKGIDIIASGDDMLLMNKIKQRYPDKIGYIFSRDAFVTTTPMPTWKSFYNQRIRWASKSNHYEDKSILIVLLLMYLFNVSLLVLPIIALFHPILFLYWLALLLLKTFVETTFAVPMSRFFKIPLKWYYAFLQLHHIVYMVIAGWLGKAGKYQWKGRQVK
jgi:cellulose synthase/poly-beta-1,6-N-acetylglucosamine synthase-like glycosyltransferase